MNPRSTTIEATAQLAGRVARAVGLLGAALALPALPALALLPIPAAAQSASDGMIMIPGNGETAAGGNSTNAYAGRANAGTYAGANAGTTAGGNAAAGYNAQGGASAEAARAEAAFQAASRGAQIVIPGNAGAGGKPAGVTVETVSGPTTPSPAAARAAYMAVLNGANSTAANPNGTNPGAANPVGTTPTAARSTPYSANALAANAAGSNSAEPSLNPAVAALLANGANRANGANPAAGTGIRRVAFNPATAASNEPSAPVGADLARLQQQAATELAHDGSGSPKTAVNAAAIANSGANLNAANSSGANIAAANLKAGATAGAKGNAEAANANAAAGAGAAGKSKLQFSATSNVPTARTMPALETIQPGQSMGTAMSPAARFAAAAATKTAMAQKEINEEAGAQGDGINTAAMANASAAAGNGNQANAADAGAQQANGRAVRPAPAVTVLSSDGPPIAHSVTVEHGGAAQFTQPALAGKQDPAVIIKTVEDFLRQQATGLPGHVTIAVPPIAPRGLAACDNIQAFMAPGAPLWGRTTVGVRCIADKPWTFYVVARISVQATYYVAARQINAGDVIQPGDLLPRDGDLAVMPRAIVTDPAQVIGGVAQNRLTPGLPVRSDLVRSVSAIQLGQTVKVVAEGNGFSISVSGSAMNNASPGQQVRVKTDNGETVVGTAAGRGVVQIPM